MASIVAYLLVVSEIGKEHDLVEEIQSIGPEITETRVVYGEYDIVVRIEVESMSKLDEIVTKIRKMPNVVRTITLISAV